MIDAITYAAALVQSGVSRQNAAVIAGVSAVDLDWASPRHRRTDYAPPSAPAPPAPPPVSSPRALSPSDRVDQVLDAVARRYGLTVADLKSHRRTRRHAWPRHEAMYEVRRATGYSQPHIGRIFGGRDHTTVIHALRSHEARMAWAEVLIALGTVSDQPDLFARAA